MSFLKLFLDKYLYQQVQNAVQTVEKQPLFVDAKEAVGSIKDNFRYAVEGFKDNPSFTLETPISKTVNKIFPPPKTDIEMANSMIDALPIGKIEKVGNVAKTALKATNIIPKIKKAPVFEGLNGLSTKMIEDLIGRSEITPGYLQQRLASSDLNLKQVEKDLINRVAKNYEGKIPVKDLAEKVSDELIPLKRSSSDLYKPNETKWNNPEAMIEEGNFTPKYEGISLPSELRGPVKSYSEHIYESPIKTSAGDTHFPYTTKNYFGHTRIEDLPGNQTRRVIEVQSDLYQKGRLANEGIAGEGSVNPEKFLKDFGYDEGKLTPKQKTELEKMRSEYNNRQAGIAKLQQYNDPTAHFRMVREEVKQAAIDGKTKLQFPTGETALKIEGLGATNNWYVSGKGFGNYEKLTPDNLKVGATIETDAGQGLGTTGSDWIITDVLGDGKFKAIPKDSFDRQFPQYKALLEKHPEDKISAFKEIGGINAEQFDISGKVDTNNPIYKFYEKDISKYLKNKYQAKLITDKQGVSWYELNVNPEQAKLPVEAFGMLPFLPNKKKEKEPLIINK